MSLSTLFSGTERPSEHLASIAAMMKFVWDPSVLEITVNQPDRIFFTTAQGRQLVRDAVFPNQEAYQAWVEELLSLTDAGYRTLGQVHSSVVEGSFKPETSLCGAVHVCMPEITGGPPVVTVRKQPNTDVSLDQMLTDQKMIHQEIYDFLVSAVHGRLNIAISGGSGAGKTTLARALSAFVDPNLRVVSVEDTRELYLTRRLPNAVSLTTFRLRDQQGRVVRETTMEDLVREALRMRADAIWVGETRGREAYALVKACNSGHDGSVTTVHADNGAAAVKQLVTYVMEGGVSEEVARDQVARAFQLVIQVGLIRPGVRRVMEITELESVREGVEQRRNRLWVYRHDQDTWEKVGFPTKHLVTAVSRYGVSSLG